MKLDLINSAVAQAGKGTRFGLEMTKRHGFDTVDIFTDPLDIDAAERRLIRETCREPDLPIVSLCCVALGLVHFSPSVLRFHLDRTLAFLDLAAEFDCSNLLLVLGEYVWQQAAALAGEGHDKSHAARHADPAGEAEAEEPALEIAGEFVLDVSRHGPLGGLARLEPTLEASETTLWTALWSGPRLARLRTGPRPRYSTWKISRKRRLNSCEVTP